MRGPTRPASNGGGFRHEELGFHDGWGTVIRQLADLVE